MISYAPFYETLHSKGITEYALIFKHGIPANTLHRMKHGEAITTKTLDELCFILDCPVSDVIEYVSPDKIWPALKKAGFFLYLKSDSLYNIFCEILVQYEYLWK